MHTQLLFLPLLFNLKRSFHHFTHPSAGASAGLAGFLEVELSHGAVHLLDALCSRKPLIFGEEGAGGSLPSPSAQLS